MRTEIAYHVVISLRRFSFLAERRRRPSINVTTTSYPAAITLFLAPLTLSLHLHRLPATDVRPDRPSVQLARALLQ
jgi:hypothetical protein